MIRHWMAIVAAGALLTGCGGSSGADAEKPAPKPTARAYTLPELAAALPEKDDVPRATKAVPQCPEIKTTCDTSKGILAQKSVKVELRPTPSELSPVEQERAAQAPGIGEFVQVSLVQHASPLPLQEVADSEPDRNGYRCRPEPMPGRATATHSDERVLCHDQQRPAQAGHGEPPADLPDGAAQHRLARSGGQSLLDGQTQGDGGQVGREREPAL